MMPSSQIEAAPIVPVTFKNDRTTPLTFVLEPWGEEYTMPPQSEVRVEFSGPEAHWPLIEWGEDIITVYGWSGSTARVFMDGQELGAGA